MEFFPLTLGVPKARPVREDKGEASPHRATQLGGAAWRESLSAPPDPVEEVPAAAVLERLIPAGALPRPWLILSEPGAGKSRLLEHWHATWLRQLVGPHLGLLVPVLVRLAETGRGCATR